MLKKLGKALLPGASLFSTEAPTRCGWTSKWFASVMRLASATSPYCLASARKCLISMESQYVPLSRFLRLPRAVGDKVLAPLQHVFRRFLEAAVTLRLRRTPGMQGQESRRTRPRDNEWGGISTAGECPLREASAARARCLTLAGSHALSTCASHLSYLMRSSHLGLLHR